jgi:DMSO reductase anchor subunit
LFFHLAGRSGWRSAARWRTSWLSREVIVLPALMAVVFAYGVAHFFSFKPVLAQLPSGIAIDATVLLGITGTVLAFALFLCTAMIYACLPFLREWASPLTVVNYTLLGGASGFTLAAAFSAWRAPDLTQFFVGWAIILTALGCASRIASLIRNHRLKPSTLQTAIGITSASSRRRWDSRAGRSTPRVLHGRAPAFVRSVKGCSCFAFAFRWCCWQRCSGVRWRESGARERVRVQYVGLAERCSFSRANHPHPITRRLPTLSRIKIFALIA